MSPRSKREILEAIIVRYRKATRAVKTTILNEFCETCGYHRKHALRLLATFRRFSKPAVQKRGRAPIYRPEEMLLPLKRIWKQAYMPCSKRLKVAIPLWLSGYAKRYGPLPLPVINALLRISPATMDRLLKPVRAKYPFHGRATTKPGTLLKKHIPVKVDQWNEKQPGFLEIDSVSHCGGSTEGVYASTIDCVDIATTWTEQRAVWGKGSQPVIEQLGDIERSLPFPLLGVDSDNGGEFLNYHLLRYLTHREQPVQFTRSREYKKDDNAHVEQKNWTHVRQWLGYDRLDDPQVVPLMNDLYRTEWRLFHNFFCPSMKLISKTRVASKTVKRYDKPKTPYQRVMESTFVSKETKQILTALFESLNPFDLRDAMEEKLKNIFPPTTST